MNHIRALLGHQVGGGEEPGLSSLSRSEQIGSSPLPVSPPQGRGSHSQELLKTHVSSGVRGHQQITGASSTILALKCRNLRL